MSNPSTGTAAAPLQDRLAPGHPGRRGALAELHALLVRGAVHEARRRAATVEGGLSAADLQDLAQQAADDALVAIVRKLADFRGESRFTTWAYRFAVFEVSAVLARHRTRLRREVSTDWSDLTRVPDRIELQPVAEHDLQELATALRRAISEALTPHQRRVFVAVTLEGSSTDDVAIQLGSNRNAVYKTLFDARTKLRAALAAAGFELAAPTTRSRA